MYPELGGEGGGHSLELKYTNQCSTSSANLSYLMKITFESPEALSNEELNRLSMFGLENLEELLFDNQNIYMYLIRFLIIVFK